MKKIELCRIGECTQCEACRNICPKQCITMDFNSEGFAYPHINRDICIECGACMKACHQITPMAEFRIPLRSLACWTKRIDDRINSSSGGAFSVIARKILSENGIVFGATIDRSLQVKHISIERIEDLRLLQGSKYVESFLGDTYLQIREKLKSGKKVLFTGTPCQVSGLLTFLKKDYENLYTCDVVCHGVPSQKAFDTYLKRVGFWGNTTNFQFRFTEGWGFRLSRQAGKTVAPALGGTSVKWKTIWPNKAYYLRAFTKGLMFNEACYKCRYAQPKRVSDLTLADYWGLGIYGSFNYPTQKGISCLLSNSEKGEALLKECSDLDFEERPLKEAIEGNHNLSKVSRRPEGRDTYLKDAEIIPISKLESKYELKPVLRDYLRILKQDWVKFKNH